MPDCLITLVDQCVDSEGYPAMGHLKTNGIPFLATRCTCSEAIRSLESTVVRVVLKFLQHLSSSTETCEVVLPLNAHSLDSP